MLGVRLQNGASLLLALACRFHGKPPLRRGVAFRTAVASMDFVKAVDFSKSSDLLIH